jgi:hypothetical protein
MGVIFDGTNTKYGSLPNSPYFNRTTDFTFLLHFKPSGGSTQQYMAGMDQNAGGSTTFSGFFHRGDASAVTSFGRASVTTHHNLGTPVLDQWNIAVFSRPNSGVTVASPSALNATDASPSTLINQSFDLLRFIIGARRVAGGSTYTDFFNGKIGAWAIWNRVLSSGEIDSLQGGAHPSTISSGLVDYMVITGTGTATTLLTNAGTTMTFVGSPALDTDSPFTAYSITDVNGDEEIDIDSTGNTINVAGFSNAISSIVVGGKAATSIAGSNPNYTFTMPPFTHGFTYPEPDATHDLVVTDTAANSAEIPIVLNSPVGMTSVTLSSPVTGDDRFMGYWMALNGHTPVNGDKMITIDADVIGTSDTGVTADDPLVTTIWHWFAATGIIYEYTVSVTEAGIISAGLTAAGLTASSLTASGLTATGL